MLTAHVQRERGREQHSAGEADNAITDDERFDKHQRTVFRSQTVRAPELRTS
jgi:hypothetical protein